MMVVASMPLWIAGLAAVVLGGLGCLVGQTAKQLTPFQELYMTLFNVLLVASGSEFFYLAAWLCGY